MYPILVRIDPICNWEKQELSLSKFKARIYALENVEAKIAQENDKTMKHHRKWDRIKELL